MNNFAHDLFLLMLSLAQQTDQERILRMFVEAVGRPEEQIEYRFITEKPEMFGFAEEVATRNRSFGWIVSENDLSNQTAEYRSLIFNAVQMLAILLENLLQNTLLANETLHLEDAIQERTNELVQKNQALLHEIIERQKAEQAVHHLNAELEKRVHERTAQLEIANHELEAFSYSIAHDLRAPLRALDGFSAILQTSYPDQLGEEGNHYLSRIRKASRRMAQLIDDLLHLARVTRAEYKCQQVNLSTLAHEITAELQAQNPHRQIEFEIAEKMVVEGDEKLLRTMLVNLLNNAIKFTSQREKAYIQVGEMDHNGERVFFVRDNGVGFNMAYASKLFVPFQRLHGINEFPGTGIGLVIVQRIIARHGGRIWPQAAEKQGATFYFTLKVDPMS